MSSYSINPSEIKTASFRDPGGRLVTTNGRILRIVNPAGYQCLSAALGSPAIRAFIERGEFVRTDTGVDAELLQHLTACSETVEPGSVVVEHERLWFPSFPYEWPPEMLWAAGNLTLDLAGKLIVEGLGLKDATPYNVLFRGPTPVFVDVLSIEQRDPLDPIWLPRAEFVRTFLLPLLAAVRLGIPLEQAIVHREGLEPEAVYRWLSPFRRILPSYLGLVSMPVWLSSGREPANPDLYRKRTVSTAEKSRFIFEHMLSALRKQLRALSPATVHSAWSGYMQPANETKSAISYTSDQFAEKEKFVAEALDEVRPSRLLDIGCNTGHFSRMAAQGKASVVAVDADPTVVGQTWRSARAEGLDILPLVVHLARPTPALGWRNQERPSFLSRATGAFDFVLMLAVVHHLLATDRVPLPDVVRLASELTTDALVVEFIQPDDPMFQRLSRGRDYTYLTPELFEQHCRAYFDIVRSRRLGTSSRWIYLLRKKR